MVVRRPVPRRLARAAADGRARLARAREAGLAGSAQFDRPEDYWPRAWPKRTSSPRRGSSAPGFTHWGCDSSPSWAGPSAATGAPRGTATPCRASHIVWGTGPGVLAPFIRRARAHADAARIRFLFRHRVDEVVTHDAAATGVRGARLAPSSAERGKASGRDVVGEFEVEAGAVVVASGGMGGNLEMVRRLWPQRMGTPPSSMVAGVPAHVDGRMLGVAEAAGARLINADRMWHYTEGLRNWDPVWENHGVRILPGPSSVWLDALGRRLPAPLFPGFDTLGTLRHLRGTGYDYSWFVLTQSIIEKEFALSGSEQNPDLTGRNLRLLASRVRPGAPGPVKAFMEHGEDFVVADSLGELVEGMNRVGEPGLLTEAAVRTVLEARDAEIANAFGKDAQVTFLRSPPLCRRPADPRGRAAPHPGPRHGPLVAVRLNVLTRKARGPRDRPVGALHVTGRPRGAGALRGRGGGRVRRRRHDGLQRARGDVPGGCLFSGRVAGRAAAAG
ncbi:FAD-binding dehydrogenase [Sinomonas flava]|uniref:FAD-binding dehydrogenase n=1 Tax=Sinomonas flava TaxID=496857 RepID=UPI0039A62F20